MRALVVTLLFGALVASACGGGENEASAPPAETTAPTAPEPGDENRPPAPPIEGTSLDGAPISLADLAGRPVLVNVWSSWWSTCQSEAVAYADFQEENPELAYLGLDVADTAEEGREFVERHGWTWPSIQDPERERARSLGATYQPHFVLVDARGRIVASHEGGGDAEIWGSLVTQLP
jgi:peroxiredoxin